MIGNTLGLSPSFVDQNFNFKVDKTTLVFDTDDIKARLLDLETPCYLVNENSGMGAGTLVLDENSADACQAVSAVAYVPCFTAEELGDPEFKKNHNLKCSYCSGAMANGIATKEMVIAMGKAGFLGSFGAGGLLPSQVEKAIVSIQYALPNGPYAFNLIHSPHEPAIEQAVVDLYLKYKVRCVEAAAFINLTPSIVHYRVAGLSRDEQGRVTIQNKVIAKISRNEVATRFLEPPPKKIVDHLLQQRLITREQAEIAFQVPMADDITVEADSGGHTDNRPLTSLLPSVISLRNRIQKRENYDQWVRVGAAGGIGTPDAAFAAFAMGAAYVVTGSINQACVEAGACAHTRNLLAKADIADTAMAPASDMFEMGVKLQVLKRGTFFPMRAQKLYDLYTSYNSLDDIPIQDREKLEKQIFQKNLDAVWDETKAFFEKRDPGQIEKAEKNPKKKMALVFRWYLGLASQWSNTGNSERKLDYQIWCGPCMGAFNAWVKGTYLEAAENRRVVDVAKNIMTGAAYLNRLMILKSQKVIVPSEFSVFDPRPFFRD
ncbi:MAG: PfaD family polyunsaturated fatty acid/polyketide biosynthesis protein [Thermodesulfobacteriota bacterium]|nr:PfaD family polyunsaturated fatty acid/polyketide biosynthesis protein [Thermodesulfobacteriota bacterium]